MAAEQWESANQGVRELTRLGHSGWTMRHALFADMGGIMLQCPDFPSFPVDNRQLAYLIEHGYVHYPVIDSQTIWERNKADGFARFITGVQIAWFSVQCLARWIQHLDVSSLEITTFATIIASLNTLFFWHHKPLDVKTPLTIYSEARLSEIILKAEGQFDGHYSRTPLDFLKPPPVKTSLVAPFWFGIRVFFDLDQDSKGLPIKVFSNCDTHPPAGISIWETAYGVMFECLYFGIHLIGWNQEFPTQIERRLWQASNVALLALVILYLVLIPVGAFTSKPFSRRWLAKEVDTPSEAAAQLPKWAKLLIHLPILGLYSIARFYVLTEGIVSLRALPLKAYVDVGWTGILPHA